jgi:hypothetical protein
MHDFNHLVVSRSLTHRPLSHTSARSDLCSSKNRPRACENRWGQQQDAMVEPTWEPATHRVALYFLNHTGCQARKGRVMDITTHRARITGPVSYLSGKGRKQHIPIGPCLVESLGGRSIDIIWGARGQSSVALPIEEVEAAKGHGHLVLLD